MFELNFNTAVVGCRNGDRSLFGTVLFWSADWPKAVDSAESLRLIYTRMPGMLRLAEDLAKRWAANNLARRVLLGQMDFFIFRNRLIRGVVSERGWDINDRYKTDRYWAKSEQKNSFTFNCLINPKNVLYENRS